MSTHKRIDLICVAVTVLAIILTVLFMNGERLGIQVITDPDSDRDEGTVYFTGNDLNGSWDYDPTAVITLNNDSISMSGSGAYVYQNSVVISRSGYYEITGTLDNGSIIVDAEDNSKVWILLDNAYISNDTGACIDVEQADKVFLILADGSENTLVSGSAFSEDTVNDGIHAALFSRDDLTISGSGTLAVSAQYKHGIEVNDDFVVTGGNITIEAVGDAVHANDSFRFCNAVMTVNAEDEGIDVDREDGYFYMESGTLEIVSADDAVHTEGNILIAGGNLTISAGDDAVHSETSVVIDGGEILINACYEGVEAPQITMNAGDVTIYPDDDGFNANGGSSNMFGFQMPWDQNTETEESDDEEPSVVTINGGSLTIINDSGRDADGIDSNGNIYISGGDIRVSLVNSGSNSTIDYGSENGGVCEISGGTVIAAGSYSMAEAFDTSSSQYSVLYTYSAGAAAGTEVRVEDSTGTVLLSWEVPNSYSSVNLSCPEMQEGETYRIVIGNQSEEITLQEVSASYGDAASGGFGGMMFMGGMKPFGGSQSGSDSEFQPSQSFDPFQFNNSDDEDDSGNGIQFPNQKPSGPGGWGRPGDQSNEDSSEESRPSAFPDMNQGGFNPPDDFDPSQFNNSDDENDSGNGIQFPNQRPSGSGGWGRPGNQNNEDSSEESRPSAFPDMDQEGFDLPDDFDPSQMTPPNMENGPGMMPQGSFDPDSSAMPEMGERPDGEGMGGSIPEDQNESAKESESVSESGSISAETLIMDGAAVALLAAALAFVKLYRKP